MNVDFTPFIAYFTYLGSGMLMLLVFLFVYGKLTPYREIHLMREGNLSAALSYGGTALGFSMALASSAVHMPSLGSFWTWGALAALMQATAYLMAKLVFKDLAAHICADNRAVGLGLFFLSVTVGLINAASLS